MLICKEQVFIWEIAWNWIAEMLIWNEKVVSCFFDYDMNISCIVVDLDENDERNTRDCCCFDFLFLFFILIQRESSDITEKHSLNLRYHHVVSSSSVSSLSSQYSLSSRLIHLFFVSQILKSRLIWSLTLRVTWFRSYFTSCFSAMTANCEECAIWTLYVYNIV